jgi:hypothetical protein
VLGQLLQPESEKELMREGANERAKEHWREKMPESWSRKERMNERIHISRKRMQE